MVWITPNPINNQRCIIPTNYISELEIETIKVSISFESYVDEYDSKGYFCFAHNLKVNYIVLFDNVDYQMFKDCYNLSEIVYEGKFVDNYGKLYQTTKYSMIGSFLQRLKLPIYFEEKQSDVLTQYLFEVVDLSLVYSKGE